MVFFSLFEISSINVNKFLILIGTSPGSVDQKAEVDCRNVDYRRPCRRAACRDKRCLRMIASLTEQLVALRGFASCHAPMRHTHAHTHVHIRQLFSSTFRIYLEAAYRQQLVTFAHRQVSTESTNSTRLNQRNPASAPIPPI